jgi:hypothetical protein
MLGGELRVGPAEGTVDPMAEVPLVARLDRLAATPARARQRPGVRHPQGRPRPVIGVEQRRHGEPGPRCENPCHLRRHAPPGPHPSLCSIPPGAIRCASSPNASASQRTAAANASSAARHSRARASISSPNCSDDRTPHSNTVAALAFEQPSVERAFVRSAPPGFRRVAAEIGSNTPSKLDRGSDLRKQAEGGRKTPRGGEMRGEPPPGTPAREKKTGPAGGLEGGQ